MKVCVVGTGYVGLVTGSCFAEMGNHVTCLDIDSQRVERLRRNEVPIFEPGLDEYIERNAEAGRLTFTTEAQTAIGGSDVVFIAVGTPPRTDGAADLSAVDKVAETIAQFATKPVTVVLKSTVPVGTNARVRNIIRGATKVPAEVVSNPEFLKEGDALNDFMRPDRVVVGVNPGDERARSAMERLYHPLCLDRDRIVWMRPESAELTKYVANTMLAMRISFMNEIAGLCEKVGADVHEVRVGVGSDSRIGGKFLYPGPGYGGSCFPKDVVALVHTAREHQLELDLACATDRVNQRQKGVLLRKVKAYFTGDLRGKRVGVWGIAFKPRTDDIRESPALFLIDGLLAEGASVVVHDPEALDNARQLYGDRVEYVDDAYRAADGADALVLVTEWRQYQNPDFARIREKMRGKLLVDGRNIWSDYGLQSADFDYAGIGVCPS